MSYESIAWLVILIAMIAVEIATLGLTTVWFAGGALVAFITSMLGGPLILQVVLFIVVSTALLCLTRPMAIRYINKGRIKTNADSLIGKTAFVIEEIDNLKATGAVTVDGQEWTARCENDDDCMPKDSFVEIRAIQGVKLIVAAKEVARN